MVFFRNIGKSEFIKPIKLLVYFILLVLPTVSISWYFNPTVTGKFMFASTFILLILGVIGISLKMQERYEIRISKLDFYLSLLFAYITINRYFFQHSNFSIRYFELLVLCVFYFIIRTRLLRNFYAVLLIIVVSGLIQSIYAVLQAFNYLPSYNHYYRITGAFFNPGPLGGFLSCVGILGFSSLGYFKKINHKYVQKVTFLLAMSILIILIMLFISKSRAGWLAFVVSGIFLIERRFYVFKNVSKKKKIAFLIMLIGFLLISMSFINIDSVRGRFFIWKNTLEIIRDNPLLGVGFDNFKTYYMDYQGKYFEENMRAKEYLLADDVEFAFNSWLQLTSENGIVGFVLVIYLVLLISKNNVGKEDLDKNLIVQTGLLCVGIFGLFSYPMQILPLKIIITVLLAYKSSMMSRKIKLASIQIQYPKATGFFGALVTLSLVFIVSNYLIGLDRGLKSWKHGLNKYRFGGYEISVKDFQNGYFYLNRNGDFLRHYGLALSKSGKPREAIKVLEKAGNIYNMSSIQLELGNNYMDLGCFEEAEKAYLKASSMVPNLFAPDFGLVKLYHMTNQNEKKQLVAKRMLTKEVKINSLSIEEMKIEVIRILSQ